MAPRSNEALWCHNGSAYSLVDRGLGYCQGSAFILGLLLIQMPEEEAFSVFVRRVQQHRLRELFKPSMAQLGLCIYQFEVLLQEQLPELTVHLRLQSFLPSMFASSWFLTLFLTTFPLPVATRVFDLFMYEFKKEGSVCLLSARSLAEERTNTTPRFTS
ncbi:EVI5-like protein [Taeniopygia guttata]|uniref:EVI5-like protein n=1 Tax=Taeniopygia guttata TaxID=59729 RepID=UPI003BB90931